MDRDVVFPLRRAARLLVAVLLAGPSVLAVAGAGYVDDAAWAALNTSVGGRLGRAEPLARPCFAAYRGAATAVDEAACAAVRAGYTTNAARVGLPGAYMQQQSEGCLAEPADQCLLDGAVTPAAVPPAGTTCGQGSVPDRYLEVRHADDVVAALAFARARRGGGGADVPLVVKNSGHDYMTRSSGRGALALWLHRLKGLVYHDDFTPAGCAKGVGRALTAAAGELTGDALVFAAAHNSTLVAGYSPTIALSGGWTLGGGHSVLSPAYGMGADRVVEFDVVTPDGARRTANACQHADLFRALRGGGVGAAFGVVLAATHRLEPSGPVAVAQLNLPAATLTAATARAWVALQARNSLRWGREGWGGHSAGSYLTHVNPLAPMANLTDGAAAAAASMRDATDFVLAHGGKSVVEVLPDFLAFWNKYVVAGAGASAGQTRVIGSRLVPQALFASEAGIADILRYVDGIAGWFDVRKLYVPVGTPFVADAAVGRPAGDPGTAVHPAWYGALWSLSNGVSLPWNATYDERLRTLTRLTEATRQAERLTGAAGGAYVNEANPFTENWRETWWGDNYKFLLGVKRKYDPDRLFNCWKCVGFEDKDVASDRFRCQGRLQEAIVEQLEGQ